VRTFVAFELPSTIREAAAALQQKLTQPKGKIGWVRVDGMHLTLKFLGEVSASRLSEIETALKDTAAGTGPLKIVVRGPGVFPGPKNPRVIWIGVESDDDRLYRLQERIDRALAAAGFPRENREFHPHLTLGRVKSSQGVDGMMKALAVHRDFMAGDCILAELHLFQSELRHGGAVYTKLWSVAL
jgi:RNA 2',3'-cyclic 3'-phosphodiesterase